jgi:hypothetical protein
VKLLWTIAVYFCYSAAVTAAVSIGFLLGATVGTVLDVLSVGFGNCS